MCCRSAGLTFNLLILVLSLSVPAAIVGAQTKELIFDLKVEHSTVPPNMRLIRVKQGDVVKLRWTSDRPITLHLHGYDIERKIVPGTVSEMAFTANATGRFPVEEHKPDAHGGHSHGEAPLVRIEVYPR
jgi:hypothetical protein